MKKPLRYIPGIDGLRAVAVLSVLVFHLKDSLLPGGFVGVDVFFVISGYVVTASLARRPEPHLGNYIVGFYARRTVRILPALIVCVLVTGVATSLFVPASWLSETTAVTGVASVLGLSNVALVLLSDDYFALRTDFNPFTHTWSLGVEEQFYAIFPLLFYVWFRARSRPGLTGTIGRTLMAAALVASLAYSAYETSAHPDFAYYLLPSRFWELACGAMLYRLHFTGRGLTASPGRAGGLIVAGGALIGLTLAFADSQAFPFPWAIPAVVGSMLVIVGSVGDVEGRSRPGALLGGRGLTYVGRISYSLYLWHWPVLVLMRWTIGLQSPLELVLAASLSIVLAVLSFHVVEQGQWWRARIAGWKASRTVAYALAGVVVCTLCLTAVLKSQPYISLSVTSDRRDWYPQSWPSATGCADHSLLGRKVFVWGDSHAGAYSTMLQTLRERTCAQVLVHAHGGCSVVGLMTPITEACRSDYDATAAEIERKGRPGDIVFLASLRVPQLADQRGPIEVTDTVPVSASTLDTERTEALREGSALVSELEDAGMHVLIDAPMPLFRASPFRCSDRFNAGNPICADGFQLERSFLEAHREPTMDALRRLAALHPAIVVWDPFPTLCPGRTCSAFDGTRPLFFDSDHLSAHGNRVLYPSFEKAVISIARRADLERSTPARTVGE